MKIPTFILLINAQAKNTESTEEDINTSSSLEESHQSKSKLVNESRDNELVNIKIKERK